MKFLFNGLGFCIIFSILLSCKKENNEDCFPDQSTTRVITNKKATVKLTATATHPVYLVEEGTFDSILIPCNFPMEFYQQDLQVTISGKVKSTIQSGLNPCCSENFVITKISR